MRLKQTVAALAGLLFIAAAGAVPTSLGAVTAGTPLTFSAQSTPGPFSDVFTFSLPLSGGSAYSAASFTLDPALLNAQSVSMSLWLDPNGVALTSDDVWIGASFSRGGSPLALQVDSLAPGTYYIVVSGQNIGIQAQYNGSITAVQAPVPEPGTYAMMLAGLAVVVAAMRRRSPG